MANEKILVRMLAIVVNNNRMTSEGSGAKFYGFKTKTYYGLRRVGEMVKIYPEDFREADMERLGS